MRERGPELTPQALERLTLAATGDPARAADARLRREHALLRAGHDPTA